jgi:hypothetical protein
MFDSLRARFSRPAADKDPTAMPAKFVYTSDEHYGETDALDILSPKQLDAVLAEGWDIIKRGKRTVKNAAGKKVTVDYLELAKKSEERGLARVPRGDDEVEDLENNEPRGLSRVDSDRSLTAPGESYLGPSGDRGLAHLASLDPNLRIAPSLSGDFAFGQGVDAAKMGRPITACTFKRGTKPHEEWMKGYEKAMVEDGKGADPAAVKDAERLGRLAAKSTAKEVTCPFPDGTMLYNAWLKAFTESGGDHVEVEANPDGGG